MEIRKLRWGVLGAAKIAVTKVIPAIQKSKYGVVTSIASRDLARAKSKTKDFGIQRYFNSYDELINDDQIDAIYIPLPNHLHVPYAIKAAEAGKHVLCEKPIALTADEASKLIDVRNRTSRMIQEAFMVRVSPVWLKAKELIDNGHIGTLKSVNANFSYFNDDPNNVRNVPEWGGGGLMDVGCYVIMASRYFFNQEPTNVVSLLDRDDSGTDILTSILMQFKDGHAILTCGTRSILTQLLELNGTNGRIRFDIPFNPSYSQKSRLFIDYNNDLYRTKTKILEFDPFDQYTLQCDAFAESILFGKQPFMSLEESIANMRVIDGIMNDHPNFKQ
jgi:predicted dehydrogenase